MTTRPHDVENMADFSRYYANSYVGYRGSDSAHVNPAMVGPLERGNNSILIRCLEKMDKGFNMGAYFSIDWNTLKKQIDFGRPDIGMLDDGPTVIFASYNTPRQAHKGFRIRELQMEQFNGWDIRGQYRAAYPSNDRYEWLWTVYNPDYRRLKEAYDDIQSGKRVGQALSRMIGIYSVAKSPHPLLAYKRWTVGYMENPTLIRVFPLYQAYSEDIKRQTGAEVLGA